MRLERGSESRRAVGIAVHAERVVTRGVLRGGDDGDRLEGVFDRPRVRVADLAHVARVGVDGGRVHARDETDLGTVGRVARESRLGPRRRALERAVRGGVETQDERLRGGGERRSRRGVARGVRGKDAHRARDVRDVVLGVHAPRRHRSARRGSDDAFEDARRARVALANHRERGARVRSGHRRGRARSSARVESTARRVREGSDLRWACEQLERRLSFAGNRQRSGRRVPCSRTPRRVPTTARRASHPRARVTRRRHVHRRARLVPPPRRSRARASRVVFARASRRRLVPVFAPISRGPRARRHGPGRARPGRADARHHRGRPRGSPGGGWRRLRRRRHPLDYGDVDAEVETLRSSVGIVDRGGRWSLLRLRGPSAITALEAAGVSSDAIAALVALQPGQGTTLPPRRRRRRHGPRPGRRAPPRRARRRRRSRRRRRRRRRHGPRGHVRPRLPRRTERRGSPRERGRRGGDGGPAGNARGVRVRRKASRGGARG